VASLCLKSSSIVVVAFNYNRRLRPLVAGNLLLFFHAAANLHLRGCKLNSKLQSPDPQWTLRPRNASILRIVTKTVPRELNTLQIKNPE